MGESCRVVHGGGRTYKVVLEPKLVEVLDDNDPAYEFPGGRGGR